MSIPPLLVTAAKKSWYWQWSQLMNGLAPCDDKGNYCRPRSQKENATVPLKKELLNRPKNLLPTLIIGRSCPWAHRTWLVFQLKNLEETINLLIAKPNPNKGIWEIEPKWMGCNSLKGLYQICRTPPSHRATVPALIDPKGTPNKNPILLGNESAQLVEVLNEWYSNSNMNDLKPNELEESIDQWQKSLQESVNNGVYKCGFARNQNAYDQASNDLFSALEKLEKSLSIKGPWLCGETLTLADIRLFPTLIRWEIIYAPLFSCSNKPLWYFPNILNWRKKFFELPKVAETCDSLSWRKDYFGALFPLRPSNIIPNSPDLIKIVNGEIT